MLKRYCRIKLRSVKKLASSPSPLQTNPVIPGYLSRYRAPVALIAALLIVHIPLLANSGLFGEDWLLFEVKPGYPIQTDFLIHGAGHPFLYIYSALANLSGNPIAFMKALALAGIMIGALNLRSFLVRLRQFSGFEATIFSFLVWSYAGYRDWATKLTATYIFSFALLCLGLNLLAVVTAANRPRLWLRLCSLAAIFCSFSLNSMIAPYFVGVFAIFFFGKADWASDRSMSARLMTSITRFADFLAVPVIYWISVNHFFPKVGPYQGYYLMRIPHIGDLISGFSNFWQWGFYRPVWEAIALTRETRWPAILMLVVGSGFVAAIIWRNRGDADHRPASAATAIYLAIAAVAVFFVCAMPYLVAGLSPDAHFYESRHLILFGLPLGLMLICAYRIVCQISNEIAGRVLVVILLSVNLCALCSGYFLQQARWLRQESLIDGLRRSYREPPAAVFDLVDGFLDHPGQIYFGVTEVTGSLHAAWDSRPLFGFTGRNERPTVLQEIDAFLEMDGSAFRNMDLWGPQATIDLVPKAPVLTNYRLSRSYYQCLVRLCDTQSFIDALADTSIRVGPIANLAPHGP
jgi:hypothetical protein